MLVVNWGTRVQYLHCAQQWCWKIVEQENFVPSSLYLPSLQKKLLFFSTLLIYRDIFGEDCFFNTQVDMKDLDTASKFNKWQLYVDFNCVITFSVERAAGTLRGKKVKKQSSLKVAMVLPLVCKVNNCWWYAAAPCPPETASVCGIQQILLSHWTCQSSAVVTTFAAGSSEH